MTLALLSILSFAYRVAMAEFNPAMLEKKWLKIGPHVINGLLLLSGFVLVFMGNWLAGNFAWLVAKILVLFVYIGFGLMAIKLSGKQRWMACAGAVACFLYIAGIAVSKQVLPGF
jgi:uncharacterized membrane protein SirB2